SAPDQASCHVIYLLKTDDGKQFEAALTVHNRGTEPVEAWQLEFAWPGGQSVVAAQAAAWEQKGRTMVVRPQEASETIAPGASRNLALSGTYSGINALPADFTLAGKSCQTTVAGATTTVVTVSEENGKRKKGDGDDDEDD
ncbi:MAG TPA: hypothetical protein DGG94_02590, partial [Micromonosporaceae bacterium]|nr:hypothetical protein [Micromonosporaceae bacterium]